MEARNLTKSVASSGFPLQTFVSWIAVLIASSLSHVILRIFSPYDSFWVYGGQFVALFLLFILTYFIQDLKPIRRLLLGLLAFVFGWDILQPIITAPNSAWSIWQQHLSPDGQIITDELVRLLPALIMALTLIGSNLRRTDLFLRVGNLRAPVQILQRLHLSISWLVFAGVFLVIAAIILPLYLSMTVNVQITSAIAHLPLILVAAALNASSEEFQFRSVLLAQSKPLGARQGIWVTTVLFALGHFFGQPSGVIGVLLAGLAGWIWAMGTIETRGIAFAWFLHFVQDVVILLFVFLAIP
jgi:membrane protease YdiL (CAAX protease family)